MKRKKNTTTARYLRDGEKRIRTIKKTINHKYTTTTTPQKHRGMHTNYNTHEQNRRRIV
jgi:hypothetical protein